MTRLERGLWIGMLLGLPLAIGVALLGMSKGDSNIVFVAACLLAVPAGCAVGIGEIRSER